MSKLKSVSPPLVIVLVLSMIFTPLLAAQEQAPAAAPSAVPAPAQAPEPAAPALAPGWWKMPADDHAVYPGNKAFNQDPAGSSSGKTWTKGGKIMTGIGLAMVGVGVIMLAAGSSEDRIGETNLAIDWKLTGALWMAGGAALTIIGLTRRH